MPADKILAGDLSDGLPDSVLPADVHERNVAAQEKITASRYDRIAGSTSQGGLKALPDQYDDPDGDWKVILSANPFEMLYLDYRQYKFITPAMVAGNHALLEKFWKNKVELMNTGGNRIAFKNKYGDGTIENALARLKMSLGKLNSKQGIEQYYTEINNERLKNASAQLKDSLEQLVLDGKAEVAEIALCLERGLKYDLTKEETSVIIQKYIDDAGLRPCAAPVGNTQAERLASTDWMTPAMKQQAEEAEKQRAAAKVQIFPGKFASTIPEIGSILFDEPKEAKEIIKEDLLKQVVAQKDIVMAREISAISKGTRNADLAFLAIVYRMNPKLPFRLMPGREANSVKELCSLCFENEQTVKAGKEALKKGYIETWLKEKDKPAYDKFIKIRDTSENVDIAFTLLLYTFAPELPYRFAGSKLLRTPVELCKEINSTKESSAAGMDELFNGSIIPWLSVTGHMKTVQQWNKVKNDFRERQHPGLEYFLHLLDPSLEQPAIAVNEPVISYPAIQSGKVVTSRLVFTNETRGCTEVFLSASQQLPGVSLSANGIFINNNTGEPQAVVDITIDSNLLLKGVKYEFDVTATTLERQVITIPVSIVVVFPTNAFVIALLKYAAIGAAFLGLVRTFLSAKFPSYLNRNFDGYADWDIVFNSYGRLGIFGGTFFIFLLGLGSGIYFLIKYLAK